MSKKKVKKNNIQDLDDLIIKPTSDLFTAVLWSAPKNEPILRGFLNAVLLDSNEPPIAKATVLNPFKIKEFAADKSLILDVRVQDELQRQYNIEVQSLPHLGFCNRTLLYWANTYSSQLRIGDDYASLLPTKSVILTAFPIFPELSELHTVFEACARENPKFLLSDHFQIHYLRLGDMLKRKLLGLEKMRPDLQHWMNFFAFGDTLSENEMSQLVNNDPLVERAQQAFHRFTANAEMREKARARRRFLEDQKIFTDNARNEEKIEIAKAMKNENCSIELIAKVTKLSQKEIERMD